MAFSSKLTEEEEFLMKKYAILRKKKKHLVQLRAKRKREEAEAAENGPTKTKQKKGIKRSASESLNPHGQDKNNAIAKIKNISSFDAAANTAAAKELIKSGAIKLKVETKTTFKRSLAKKKRDEAVKKPVFQPFNPGSTSSSDTNEESSQKKPPVEQTRSSDDASSRKNLSNNRREGFNRFKKDRKFDRSTPRKGNTIYIHGYNLSESLLKENFSKMGKIIKIDIEQNNKSGFITFNSFEAADEAIEKMNDAMVAGTRLKVSLARRQKMLESAVSSSVWAPLAVSHSDKGPSNVKEKRALVVYDDDFFSDD